MVIFKWKERGQMIVYEIKSVNYSTKPVYHTCLQLKAKEGYINQPQY